LHAGFFGNALEVFGDARKLLLRIDLRQRLDELRVLGTGQKQHAFDHPRQAFALFEIRCKHGLIFVGRTRA